MCLNKFITALISKRHCREFETKCLVLQFWVNPFFTLNGASEDLAAGRDPVLARAFELVGVKMSPEKARALFPTEWRKR